MSQAKQLVPLALIIILAFSSIVATAKADRSDSTLVIVRFNQDLTHDEKLSILGSVEGALVKEYSIINGVAASIPLSFVEQLMKNPFVEAVRLMSHQYKMLDTAADHQIGADQIWPMGFTGVGVRIAVLDTGIDQNHPEFTGRILVCRTEVPNTICQDNVGHGTHVAGILGASGVNAQARGVAPDGELLIDRVLDNAGSTGTRGNIDIIAGINWAANNQAQIINLSLGGTVGGSNMPNCDTTDQDLADAIHAVQARGVIVVAASGNDAPKGLVASPGCIGGVIAVGAVDANDVLFAGSDTGPAMANHGLVAPGVNLLSSRPFNLPMPGCMASGANYAICTGTSMATPVVSGAIALLLGQDRTLTLSDIRSILFSTSDCVPVGTSCPNNDFGYGRINVFRAMNALRLVGYTMSSTTTPSSQSFFCTSTSCDPPLTVTYAVSAGSSGGGLAWVRYIAPQFPGTTRVTGPSIITVPSSGSITVTLTDSLNGPTGAGYYTWTLRGGANANSPSTNTTIVVTRQTGCYPHCPSSPQP